MQECGPESICSLPQCEIMQRLWNSSVHLCQKMILKNMPLSGIIVEYCNRSTTPNTPNTVGAGLSWIYSSIWTIFHPFGWISSDCLVDNCCCGVLGEAKLVCAGSHCRSHLIQRVACFFCVQQLGDSEALNVHYSNKTSTTLKPFRQILATTVTVIDYNVDRRSVQLKRVIHNFTPSCSQRNYRVGMLASAPLVACTREAPQESYGFSPQ